MKKLNITFIIIAVSYSFYMVGEHRKSCHSITKDLYDQRKDILNIALNNCNVAHPTFGCFYDVQKLNEELVKKDEEYLKTIGCGL